ncbi:hypothetical protein D3C84_736550 [compost metagenome]
MGVEDQLKAVHLLPESLALSRAVRCQDVEHLARDRRKQFALVGNQRTLQGDEQGDGIQQLPGVLRPTRRVGIDQASAQVDALSVCDLNQADAGHRQPRQAHPLHA